MVQQQIPSIMRAGVHNLYLRYSRLVCKRRLTRSVLTLSPPSLLGGRLNACFSTTSSPLCRIASVDIAHYGCVLPPFFILRAYVKKREHLLAHLRRLLRRNIVTASEGESAADIGQSCSLEQHAIILCRGRRSTSLPGSMNNKLCLVCGAAADLFETSTAELLH